MQTKAVTATTTVVAQTELLVNAMVVANDHHLQQQQKVLHHQQQQQQQLHNHQRLTLMAITQNSMTTGSAAANLAQSSGGLSSSSSSSSSSGASSASSTTGNSSSTGALIDNLTKQHKLSNGGGSSSNSDNNQQHHHHRHSHQPPHHHHLPNAGGIAGVMGGVVGAVNGAMKQKNIAIISPNNSHNGIGGGGSKAHHHHPPQHHKSPTVLRKHHHHEHHHAADISKFNRSNRKSKNCAIFYFKHLDTDNETNYSNSNCGDDVHDMIVGGDGVDNGSRLTVGVDDDGIVSGGAHLSSAASLHASDLLKSAEVSSDDEGWLYTASGRHQQQSTTAHDSLNSNHIARVISSTASGDFHGYDLTSAAGSIQSATVSSSTACTSAVGSTILGDADSDKENKQAALGLTKIHNSPVASPTTSTTFVVVTTSLLDSEESCSALKEHSSGASVARSSSCAVGASSSSRSSSITSSSCSSNDMLTEATTTTTSMKSNATKIRSKPQHKQHQRREMELQINNNHGNGHHHKSPTSTTKQHNIVNNTNNNNNNNNDANSSPSISTNTLHKTINNGNSMIAPASSSPPQHARNSSYSDDAANGNLEKENIRSYTRADLSNINVKPNDNQQYHHSQYSQYGSPSVTLMYAQQLHGNNVGKRLPPRSPAKSHTSTTTSTSTISPVKGKVSHESIKQLVLEAEHLVRDEALKTPTKPKQHSINSSGLVQISSTIKKREVCIMPGPIKRVQEWLEHQPSTPAQLKTHSHNQDHQLVSSPSSLAVAVSPARTDDCEASGEASETDSIPQQCSDDTSEGFTESIATCMQTSTNSYGNSTERMGGSAEPMVVASSNQSLNVKVVKRQQTRRKSERPWSVSCLSQLTTDAKQVAAKVSTIANVQSGLASHSISESALDSLSPGRPRTSSTAAQVKSYESKGSLKRRKTRKKKLNYATANASKKSDTNSEDNQQAAAAEYSKHPQAMLLQSCESMTPQQMQEITQALLQLQNCDGSNTSGGGINTSEQMVHCGTTALAMASATMTSTASNGESGEEENHLMKPNFRVGSFTTAYMTNEARLGSLAKLANYMNDEEQLGAVTPVPQKFKAREYTTGTEDHHSSFSETAWDNYQEKYNSENYSEGFDSDAARKLMEFGDDYRNFIDSQSDCCSSLSAANNLDSLSPPRMDSLQQNESKIVITQDTIVSSVDHARRRRALELEYERRRKNLEIRRKSCQGYVIRKLHTGVIANMMNHM
uniref:Uncharacterized protein n=1 Tax=Stomoxys calcitrans TaxID=35570 RepID=A0A1I8PK09_STOCA